MTIEKAAEIVNHSAEHRQKPAIRGSARESPSVEHLLDVLSLSRFRRELEGLGGYDTRATGHRVL